ncbi:TlpA family protein disulfide reductase [Zunongwangia pacifica]|uniref:TlpA family protein disulfide reductase n=1 Tax=Zunongwangia pacifica TaxID=2911062 RepID=A0A9X1ZUZ4_9FLAO|nr:TlpA disulfide reductase family protein [Zunongwangia pacifica]MCL6220449.1 TlpA family protein disulfide reductase [Zunongwangia pacifica]
MKKLLLILLMSGSVWAQGEDPSTFNYEDFSLLPKVEEKEAYYEAMLRASNDKEQAQQDEYLTALAVGWLAKGNEEKYRYYMKDNPEISFVNLVNLIYALEYLENDEKYAKLVESVSNETIKKIEEEAAEDDLTKSRMQVLLEINAMANAILGHAEVAQQSMERASALKGDRESKYFKDSKANYYKRYAAVLVAQGEQERALDTLTTAVSNADSNPESVALLKDIYTAVHGNGEDVDALVQALQQKAYEHCYKEVEKKYITNSNLPFNGTIPNPADPDEKLTIFEATKPVYEISLPDLNGKPVNLADYKGDVLVIDSWTTLCTPCVAAFAGFDLVVEEYKEEAFQLFVMNLFEPQKTVKSFVGRKNIDLDVLQDEPNTTYQIRATPTKIIFDPQGNIRFYSSGYAGSTHREYYKLKAMVEIVKKRASI